MTRKVSGAAVTPSDTDSIPTTAALWVGGAGNVCVVMAGGGRAEITLEAVPAGTMLEDLAVVQVKATGTTATKIVALR